MGSRGWLRRGSAAGLVAAEAILCAVASPAQATGTGRGEPAVGGRPQAGSIAVTCASGVRPALAARLSRDIRSALRGRLSLVGLRVDDQSQQVSCWLNARTHFDSASVVKATILGAVLRQAIDQHRHLTEREVSLAIEMITESDNDAASALWAQIRHGWLTYFLRLATMTETRPGPGGYWGLTQITAHDEWLLLRHLMYANSVLDTPSRNFALSLMAHVTPAQQWGVPAGAPAGRTVHVKNGWLPLAAGGWRINSIGCFTGHRRSYSIVILTQDNPSMAYGITTIERAAELIHHDLNPTEMPVIPPSAADRSWGTPDEHIPDQLATK